jgi:hypothetical protein
MKAKPARRVYVARRILVALIVVLLFFVARGIHREVTEPAYTCDVSAAFVEQGDSIWTLLEDHCEGDLTSARYFVTGIYGTKVYAGQLILLTKD